MLWLHIGKMLKHNLLLAHYFCPFPWQRNGCKEIACPSPKPAITEFLFCELRLNLKHFTVYLNIICYDFISSTKLPSSYGNLIFFIYLCNQ